MRRPIRVVTNDKTIVGRDWPRTVPSCGAKIERSADAQIQKTSEVEQRQGGLSLQ